MRFKKTIGILTLILGLFFCASPVFPAPGDYKVDNQGRVWAYDLITKGPWVDVRAWGVIGDATGVTGVGTDNTAALRTLFESLALVGGYHEIVLYGLYRVKMTAATGYSHHVFKIPSNTTIRAGTPGSGIFFDNFVAYGETDIPYLFAIWGGVSNITLRDLTILGRSAHTYNGATCGTHIGIRGRYHNGTSWSANPGSMADVPQNILIDNCTFINGREAIHIDGEYANGDDVTLYSPYHVRIVNPTMTDFEHCIGLNHSMFPVTIENPTVIRDSYVQRGIGIWYSKHVRIKNLTIEGSTDISSGVAMIGGIQHSTTIHPVDDISIDGLFANEDILRANLIATNNLDSSNAVRNINISNVNAPTSTINLQATTVGDGVKKVNLSNFNIGQLRAYGVDGLKVSNGSLCNYDLSGSSNIDIDTAEVNGSVTTPYGVLATVNSQCFDLVGITGLRINNSDLIIGDLNGFAGLNFISGSFSDINLTNSRVRQYANIATTQRLINSADGLTIAGLKIINNQISVNYVMATFGTFLDAIIQGNVCSLNALMHKYGDVFTGMIKDNYNLGAFTVATDGSWTLIGGIIHDVDGSVNKSIKLNDGGTALVFQ